MSTSMILQRFRGCVMTILLFLGLIHCSEGSDSVTTPLQEAPQRYNSHAKDFERELLRKKRLERLSSSEADKSHSLPEGRVTRSMSSPSNSSALSQGTVSPSSKNAVDSLSPVKGAISSPTRTEFEVGSVVKVERKPKPWYGVIKYIGDIPNVPGRCAGIEMVCDY